MMIEFEISRRNFRSVGLNYTFVRHLKIGFVCDMKGKMKRLLTHGRDGIRYFFLKKSQFLGKEIIQTFEASYTLFSSILIHLTTNLRKSLLLQFL